MDLLCRLIARMPHLLADDAFDAATERRIRLRDGRLAADAPRVHPSEAA